MLGAVAERALEEVIGDDFHRVTIFHFVTDAVVLRFDLAAAGDFMHDGCAACNPASSASERQDAHAFAPEKVFS